MKLPSICFLVIVFYAGATSTKGANAAKETNTAIADVKELGQVIAREFTPFIAQTRQLVQQIVKSVLQIQPEVTKYASRVRSYAIHEADSEVRKIPTAKQLKEEATDVLKRLTRSLEPLQEPILNTISDVLSTGSSIANRAAGTRGIVDTLLGTLISPILLPISGISKVANGVISFISFLNNICYKITGHYFVHLPGHLQ